MKKISKILVVVIILILAVVGLCACKDASEETTTYTVTFNSNGGSIVESITTDGSLTIEVPNKPTKEGYVFDGWYWDNETFEKPFTVNSILDAPIQEDTTVYAKWVIVDEVEEAEDVEESVEESEFITTETGLVDFKNAYNNAESYTKSWTVYDEEWYEGEGDYQGTRIIEMHEKKDDVSKFYFKDEEFRGICGNTEVDVDTDEVYGKLEDGILYQKTYKNSELISDTQNPISEEESETEETLAHNCDATNFFIDNDKFIYNQETKLFEFPRTEVFENFKYVLVADDDEESKDYIITLECDGTKAILNFEYDGEYKEEYIVTYKLEIYNLNLTTITFE